MACEEHSRPTLAPPLVTTLAEIIQSSTLNNKPQNCFFPDEGSPTVEVDEALAECDEYSFEPDDEEIDNSERDELDLAQSIKGMYRILDLISEQSSGDLVNKIIISQNSLKAFINSVSPGAYTSVTKVNFKALDKFIVKPVGVYGSKAEIVRFLSQRGVIDDAIAAQLLVNADTCVPTQPTLRSGLYILKGARQAGNVKEIFLLYWPEETSWDDTAVSSVRRNRVTFMRYLTKMCDQVVALISPEHAQTIVWSDSGEDDLEMQEPDPDESGRRFNFEVAQTNEQEESVQVREGFRVVSEKIVDPKEGSGDAMKPEVVKPFLLFGETAQGFMTVEYREARRSVETFEGRQFDLAQLGSLLDTDCLRINEALGDESLEILVRSGLDKRFPQECSQLKRRGVMQKMSSQGLIQRVNAMSAQIACTHTLHIDRVYVTKSVGLSSSTLYRLSGSRETREDPTAVYTVHSMNLANHDQHELQLNPEHSFKMPTSHSVLRAQLLEGEKLLLVVADGAGNLTIYLEDLAAMDGAIKHGRGKALNREKIGHDFLLAYDESKRILCVVSADKLQLRVFAFDDARRFQALGSPISLSQWYADGTLIRGACFISGSEEVLLVDSQAQARVFSFVTLQFRPATLDLKQIPYSVSSTPDGSCLLVAQAQGNDLALTAYHWSTFGSTEGIPLNIQGLIVEMNPVITSLISRTAVHLLILDLPQHVCHSYALNITRKVTEFTFKEKGICGSPPCSVHATAHNCLLDCFSDVWTRFPVLPAVQRETISSSRLKSQKTLVFVTDRDYGMYAPHFAEMIQAFERGTKKPTGDVLKSIKVSSASFSVFAAELLGSGPNTRSWNFSQYRAGEWIVDFLCLIPIHIAVGKENRFIPLKDGVYSPELEKSLLGAGVNRIVDSLSFGWYESLFQSYMASKPVKVVSSMGERSVGKSVALDHLVDTSFGGSAMRTTEGVWMSVTPTQDALLVALEFNGVHSIERSAQEDALLVLFNAAISNLVLFRNNFALNRDITGLFQPFQSSSTMLDPKANPSLFQSTLAIVIKDVVDSDKAEIAKEFWLKFQRIVQDERETNFISRLHAGKLSIIPWPVIESQEFYELSRAVKRRLDQQMVTHRTAGEFLHTMKVLMAKLKVNDWGPISQTMASHRAQIISTRLANAFAFGFAEIDPDREPLKNLDTDQPVDLPDTTHQLLLACSGFDKVISCIRNVWDAQNSRQHMPEQEWIRGLSSHLETIVKLRVAHVREWLTQNLSRFPPGLASIDELERTFQNTVVDMESHVQLCELRCSSCQLLCVRSRVHPGSHDCRTDHLCAHECDFCLEALGEHKRCTITAGHAGKHVCDGSRHLCGKPCRFLGRHGCLDACAKAINHPGNEHLCAAPLHTCGKPCSLAGVKLADDSMHSCPGKCRIPSGVTHTRHECDARVCSIQCQLCKRACSDQDHMHGLDPSAIHLCGQEHLCTSICSAPGICEIETAPHPIDATFTGRNGETLHYTQYTQVAKRLKCIKPIPPGATKHTGPHNHSLDGKVIHFCEARCENCRYFCTLPLGHPQQEHETHHGTMSRARWTLDGPDGVSEIEGRKFSTNDEGAPMMCNLVCQAMGRHVHIDYCRAHNQAPCAGNPELQHITKRIQPDPDKPKDFLTHNLFWKRSGFKDPYSKEEQSNFAKCDSKCRGPEHTASAGNAELPSYCVLPLFHAPLDPNTAPAGTGYISQDGHQFSCMKCTKLTQKDAGKQTERVGLSGGVTF